MTVPRSWVELLIWQGEPWQVAVCCVFIFCLVWSFNKLYFRRRSERFRGLQVRDPRKGHWWSTSDFINKPTYCSVCEEPFVKGSFCDSCLVCTHEKCMAAADERIACKALVLTRSKSMRHHFVKGNLPLCSSCARCGRACAVEPRLCDIHCVWCQRTWHEGCVGDVAETDCDLGRYASMLLPPYCVILRMEGWRGQRRLVVDSLSDPGIADWSPLLVLANPSSGEKVGDHLLSAFRNLLNPAQVVSLADVSAESALDLCRLEGDHQWRVVVCGGDGTVSWVFSAIDKAQLKIRPVLGIVPLGTGNDLARVLGWGKGYDNEDITEVLDNLQTGKVVRLDRWRVNIDHSRFMGLRRPSKRLVMNNYFGIGCDACVTLNFHNRRESMPSLFTNRVINKAVFFGYGSKEVLARSCKDLQKRLEVELDGVQLELPELEGVVVLNINSWGAGVPVWGDGGGENGLGPCRIDDGLVEVFAVYSSLHIARLQVSLAEPHRLGQARTVRITLKSGWAPVHVDGEPWEQSPGTIRISHFNQMTVLEKQDVGVRASGTASK